MHQLMSSLKFQPITRKLHYKQYFFVIAILFCASVVMAQSGSRAELEKKRKRLLDDIAFTTKLIDENKKNANSNLSLLNQIKTRYGQRKELVSTINSELLSINKEIRLVEKEVETRTKRIEEMKAKYARVLQQSYRMKLLGDDWGFIWSADNMNQAFARWRYLRQFNSYQQKEAAKIAEEKKELDKQLAILEENKNEKNIVLKQENEQMKLIENELKEQNELMTQIKSQEKKLKKDLDDYKKAQKKLSAEIEKMIQEEIERDRKRREEEARKAAAKNKPAESKKTDTKAKPNIKSLPDTPQNIALSTGFANNKGKLPWPVSRGLVSKKFGDHPHPTIPGIMINHSGIGINTEANATVMSVFEGEVIAVRVIPGYRTTVLIKHGQYYTAYSNLSNVKVSVGDKVSANQAIGTSDINDMAGDYEINFEIWKNKTRLDPLHWIAKR